MEANRVWNAVLSNAAPILLSIIGYFIASELSSIDERLGRVEKLLIDVPVAQEQIRAIQQKNKEQDEQIVNISKMFADLPRNNFDIRRR